MLCALVLLPRIGISHLHLCFDGAMPVVELHASADGLDFASPSGDAGHDDLTVDVSDPLIVKQLTSQFDDLALLVVVLLVALSPLMRPVPIAGFAAIRSAPAYLRPPLRGPPA
jgi:hypothetical protein